MCFRLKEIRESKVISRYRLSKLSGLNESTLQAIENSDNPNPTFQIMCKLADALGVNLDDFRQKEKEGW